jgi:hypothetical protein
MSVTSKFNTKAGDVTITFTMPVFGGTDTFQTLDIGNLDYDFDVTAFGSVVNNLGAMYGRTRLTVGYYTDQNRNFFDVLYNELYVSQLLSGKIPVNIKVVSYTGSTYEFNYEIRGNSLEHNENTTSIQLELDPVIPSTTVSGVFANVSNKIWVGTGLNTGGASGILAGSLINYVVSGFNSNLPTLHEPAFADSTYASLTYAVPVVGFIPDGTQLYVRGATASGLAINDVAQFAVLGGDIYGTGFDYNFYVNRMRTDRTVTVSYDDLQALKYSVTPSPYNAIVLTLDGTSGFVVDTSKQEISNVRSEKLISGFYSLESYVFKARKVPVGGLFADIDYTGYLTSDLETVIVSSGILAHQKALNAQSTPLVRVEATVFGFDKIKPYNTIIFGDGVPDRYRYVSGTTARYYRPTHLSYNLKEDLIRVRMYGIS